MVYPVFHLKKIVFAVPCVGWKRCGKCWEEKVLVSCQMANRQHPISKETWSVKRNQKQSNKKEWIRTRDQEEWQGLGDGRGGATKTTKIKNWWNMAKTMDFFAEQLKLAAEVDCSPLSPPFGTLEWSWRHLLFATHYSWTMMCRCGVVGGGEKPSSSSSSSSSSSLASAAAVWKMVSGCLFCDCSGCFFFGQQRWNDFWLLTSSRHPPFAIQHWLPSFPTPRPPLAADICSQRSWAVAMLINGEQMSLCGGRTSAMAGSNGGLIGWWWRGWIKLPPSTGEDPHILFAVDAAAFPAPEKWGLQTSWRRLGNL